MVDDSLSHHRDEADLERGGGQSGDETDEAELFEQEFPSRRGFRNNHHALAPSARSVVFHDPPVVHHQHRKATHSHEDTQNDSAMSIELNESHESSPHREECGKYIDVSTGMKSRRIRSVRLVDTERESFRGSSTFHHHLHHHHLHGSFRKRHRQTLMLQAQQLSFRGMFNNQTSLLDDIPPEERQYRIMSRSQDGDGAIMMVVTYFNKKVGELLSMYMRWSFKASFGEVTLVSFLVFTVLITFFAILIFWLEHYQPDCVIGASHSNGGPVKFGDAYHLSWTTLSTVGYGITSPGLPSMTPSMSKCVAINILMAFESFVGVLFGGITGAIIFAKVARIQSNAHVIFSDPILIRYGSGCSSSPFHNSSNHMFAEDAAEQSAHMHKEEIPCPVLEFRVLNELSAYSGGEIMDASVNIIASTLETGASKKERERERERARNAQLVCNKPPNKSSSSESGRTTASAGLFNGINHNADRDRRNEGLLPRRTSNEGSNSGGLFQRRPSNDGGLFQRRPSNDGGLFQLRPSNDGGLFQRRPSNEGRTFQRRPSNDGGRSPSHDHNGGGHGHETRAPRRPSGGLFAKRFSNDGGAVGGNSHGSERRSMFHHHGPRLGLNNHGSDRRLGLNIHGSDRRLGLNIHGSDKRLGLNNHGSDRRLGLNNHGSDRRLGLGRHPSNESLPISGNGSTAPSTTENTEEENVRSKRNKGMRRGSIIQRLNYAALHLGRPNLPGSDEDEKSEEMMMQEHYRQSLRNEIKSELVNTLSNAFISEWSKKPVEKQTTVRVDEEESQLAPRQIFHKLEVETDSHPFFKRVWNVRHILNEHSPLLPRIARKRIVENNGFWPEEYNNANAVRKLVNFHEIIVSLSGTANVSGSSVYSQKVYSYGHLHVGYTFANVLVRDWEGRMTVDHALINDVREQEGGGAEPIGMSDLPNFVGYAGLGPDPASTTDSSPSEATMSAAVSATWNQADAEIAKAVERATQKLYHRKKEAAVEHEQVYVEI